MQISTNKFVDIIKKISLLSDLEKKKEPKFSNLEVKSFIEEIKNEYLTEKHSHKIVLIDLINENGILNIDKNLIFQAISAILNNAEKFSPKESEIQITCQKNDQNLFIDISDTGLGMDESEIPLVFNKFYKGSNSENIPGEGLGLSIAREILIIHNGDIEFISKLHEGSKIKLILPIIKLLRDQ
jgi:K+-sensing histidine kinase KdpD